MRGCCRATILSNVNYFSVSQWLPTVPTRRGALELLRRLALYIWMEIGGEQACGVRAIEQNLGLTSHVEILIVVKALGTALAVWAIGKGADITILGDGDGAVLAVLGEASGQYRT